MWKTFLVGTALFYACLYGYWRFAGGDWQRFLPGLVTIGVAFAAGTATGIVANAPRRARPRARAPAGGRPLPDSFEITE